MAAAVAWHCRGHADAHPTNTLFPTTLTSALRASWSVPEALDPRCTGFGTQASRGREEDAINLDAQGCGFDGSDSISHRDLNVQRAGARRVYTGFLAYGPPGAEARTRAV